MLPIYSISCLNFCGTLAKTLRATWTWQRWTFARGNSSLKTDSNPDNPSIIPRVTFPPSSPRDFRSLKNSRQEVADSLSPAWKLNTSFCPASVTPMATKTGTISMLPPTRIWKWTPSTNRYLIPSPDKSLRRHASTAALSSALKLLISAAETLRPISLSESIDNVRVLIPAKNMMLKSRATSSSYCLLRGIMDVLNSPLRSLGTFTWTSPTPLRVNLRP